MDAQWRNGPGKRECLGMMFDETVIFCCYGTMYSECFKEWQIAGKKKRIYIDEKWRLEEGG